MTNDATRDATRDATPDATVKPGPLPWTVEKTIATPEQAAILALCDAVESLAAALSGDKAALEQTAQLVAEARELAKPDTAVIYDPSHPMTAKP